MEKTMMTLLKKGNGVLECKSYVSISDIENRYKTTFGLENEWLILKNILINEDTLLNVVLGVRFRSSYWTA